MGGKARLSKELVPIIQSYITEDTKGYLEPFVGGANIIDKIKCKNKIGIDIHKELIELLKYAQVNNGNIPDDILKEEYSEVKNNKDKYPKWYVGLVGFCGSFGAKYFGGYAYDPRYIKRGSNGSAVKTSIKNLKKQSPKLKDIKFKCCNFLDLPIDKIKGYVIYCDPPYRDTTGYKTKAFPYEKFYEWVKKLSIHNKVLITEYNMPDEFQCIWQKEHKVLIDSNRKSNNKNNDRIEKLFTYNIK
ncbi:DNA adenine methylase [Clostridium botulinum]|nr:DNA adenine methylase [Clostridium botulinum]EKS4395689.1 DNA adenine methylase [Clostridium botulinum]